MKKPLTLVIVMPLLMFVVLWSHLTAETSTMSAPTQTAVAATTTADITDSSLIALNRHPIPGALRLMALNVNGPNICTRYGDPYSPLNSPWAPGPYTYQFAIEIPADYEYDTVRVELLDPDSINRAENEALVTYTDAAVAQGLPSTPETLTCTYSSSQRDPCLIETEYLLYASETLPLEVINPFWHIRLDQNNGAGAPPGNGDCGLPSNYTPTYNTRTIFQLHYTRLNPDSTVVRVNLASYTGQVGDGVYDNGEHDTDLRWVSPGGTQRADQSVFVPVDGGSAQTFTIDLQSDAPNIVVDDLTGKRYLYLDVTTLRGASGNAFHIWAGPEAPNASLPSDVNQRNVFLVNNPAYDAYSLPIYALNDLPLVSFTDSRAKYDIVNVPANFGGEAVLLSTFDMDSGANPPVMATLDALTAVDWSPLYNFLSGDDNWATYPFTMPAGLAACDYLNPNPIDCTPFSGGWLGLSLDTGRHDRFVLSAALPDLPVNTTVGCEGVFPMGVESSAVSLDPTDFPDAADFYYPTTPPTINNFLRHISNTHLLANWPGTIYRLPLGSGASNFLFARWNEGVAPSGNTLINSLTWPGNTGDYTNHSDGGVVIAGSGFDHVVRGYIELGDPTDQTLHIQDWVPLLTGSIASVSNSEALKSLVDTGRPMRLPLWQINDGNNTGVNDRVLTSGFGLFRLHGYQFSQPGAWILLELVRLEEGCGQLPTPAIPTVSFEATTYDVVEDTAVLTLPVTIDRAPTVSVPVTVTLGGTAVDSDDYSLTSPNPLIFLAGATAPQTVTLAIVDDLEMENSETIFLTLNAGPEVTLTQTQAAITIRDNDFVNYLPLILRE